MRQQITKYHTVEYYIGAIHHLEKCITNLKEELYHADAMEEMIDITEKAEDRPRLDELMRLAGDALSSSVAFMSCTSSNESCITMSVDYQTRRQQKYLIAVFNRK